MLDKEPKCIPHSYRIMEITWPNEIIPKYKVEKYVHYLHRSTITYGISPDYLTDLSGWYWTEIICLQTKQDAIKWIKKRRILDKKPMCKIVWKEVRRS